MILSKNLSLKEMIATNTGIENKPNDAHIYKLFLLAKFLFQPIRNRWGAIKITSGFRSEAVNSAVDGAETSQHAMAEAFDMVPLEANILDVWAWIRDRGPTVPAFGQAIYEHVGIKKWIHISMPRMDKENEVMLKYDGIGYRRI